MKQLVVTRSNEWIPQVYKMTNPSLPTLNVVAACLGRMRKRARPLLLGGCESSRFHECSMLRYRLSLREDDDTISFAQLSVTVTLKPRYWCLTNVLRFANKLMCRYWSTKHLPIYVYRSSLSTLYHRWTRTWLNYSHVQELQLKLGKTPTFIILSIFLYHLLQPHCSYIIYTRKVIAPISHSHFDPHSELLLFLLRINMQPIAAAWPPQWTKVLTNMHRPHHPARSLYIQQPQTYCIWTDRPSLVWIIQILPRP